MSRLFVACELGEAAVRVLLGTLHKEQLTLSEILRFNNVPSREKNALYWDIAQLYQDTLTGLREVGRYQEPVDSISCTSWPADYLLFHADASFIPPTHHYASARTDEGRKEILSKVSWENIYAETGRGDSGRSTLFQIGAEKPKLFKRADHLLPVADGFNFLLSGVPCVETSSACATHLYNPLARAWSDQLVRAVDLPPAVLPPLVRAGTKLKPLRPELVQATGLEDTHVVASCSNELAAALAGVPVGDGAQLAFVRLGRNSVVGAQLAEPVINRASLEANLSHTVGANGAVYGHLETAGLGILEECRRAWAEDQALDEAALMHLAATAAPLESLVDLTDPRFAAPGNLVEKVQAFCRESGQTVPRKPGAIYRCLMESLAFLYRWSLDEITNATGGTFTQLCLLGESGHNMLNHFIANAAQLPVVVAPAESAAIGNVLVQALAMGRIASPDEARRIVRQSFKTSTVMPHPAATWAPVYNRFLKLTAMSAAATA
jgi:rhamnulokinase